jgi:predicted  nucleic acid-binding Zn-ribbon protein
LGKNVRILAQLQEIDLKIDSSRGEMQALLDEIHSLEARADEMRQAISGQITELDGIEDEKRALEENLAAEADAINRSEARLRDIKTQKEYQAVSKEIAAAKKVKSDLEEQVLQRITRSDELKTIISEKENVLREFDSNSAVLKSELQGKIERLEADITNDTSVREATAKDVSPSMMKRYLMLRERRQGLAIAEARSGSCLGCNMNLPPQLFNSLYKADNLVACPHCQRLLFLRQEGENTAI